MQKLAKGLEPKEVVTIILRRRWFIIIPLCLSIIAGIYLAFTLPRVYSAVTAVLIVPQKVSDDYVRSAVSTDIDSRINTIKQQILSRRNIYKIIDKFNLSSGPQYKRMYLEDQIKNIREQISVHVESTDRHSRAYAFYISFRDKDPEIAMRIANILANDFISENLKFREGQSVGTSEFIDDERETMGKMLEKVDQKLRRYRQKHMGELPEQLETNLRILDRLQVKMNESQQRLSDAKNRLFLITSGRMVQFGKGNLKSIEQLLAELGYLKTKYTDQHPDVVRIKGQIVNLERGLEKGTKETAKESSEIEPSTNGISLSILTKRQREELEEDIRHLENEVAELNSKIKDYQRRVENTPKRDYELAYLMRDYNNIQNAYNSLLGRKLDSEIAVSMEEKQKSEQFRIIDPAIKPQKPISPDMKKLFLMALAIGLGIGGGLIFLLEHFDTSFKSPEDIESYLGFSVHATIPMIYSQKDKRKQKFNQVSSIFSIMLSFVLLAVFAMLTFNGVEQTMEIVGRFITI